MSDDTGVVEDGDFISVGHCVFETRDKTTVIIWLVRGVVSTRETVNGYVACC